MADVDLGTQAVRNVVENFLPYSFTQVNHMVHKFRIAERRHVYTTPKSFLELLKLFSMLLGSKRKDANDSIDRLAHGLTKLRETAAAVTQIEADLKISLEEADQKRAVAEGIAEVRTSTMHCILSALFSTYSFLYSLLIFFPFSSSSSLPLLHTLLPFRSFLRRKQ